MLTRRLRTPAAALLIALLGACALASPAGAATKPYSVVIAPTTVPVAVSIPFQATLTNRTTNQTLGSANLTAPARLSVASASVGGRELPPCSGTSSSCRSGNLVQLRNLGLATGKSVVVTVVATAGSSAPCAPADCTWTVPAKQSNDFNGTGNDFGPLVDSSLVTSVTSVGTATQGNSGSLKGDDANISVSVPGGTGLVTISRGGGIDCLGYDEILAQDFIVEFVPNPGTVGGTKTVTIVISKTAMQASTNNGLSQVNVCFEAPFLFAAKPNTLQQVQPGVFRGLLPDCGTPPCVADRQSVGGGATIVARAPGGDQDPRYGP